MHDPTISMAENLKIETMGPSYAMDPLEVLKTGKLKAFNSVHLWSGTLLTGLIVTKRLLLIGRFRLRTWPPYNYKQIIHEKRVAHGLGQNWPSSSEPAFSWIWVWWAFFIYYGGWVGLMCLSLVPSSWPRPTSQFNKMDSTLMEAQMHDSDLWPSDLSLAVSCDLQNCRWWEVSGLAWLSSAAEYGR